MTLWSANPHILRDRVAVVAGATRGAGRGIAAALGEAGATVICTGRSTRATGSAHSDYDRPETIEETAELVTQLGGTGVARAVDHLDRHAVMDLAGWIHRTHGHIDVLVNDIWGAEVLKGGPAEWNTPIWKHDLDKGLRILRLGIETHVVTSHYLLPLLVDRPGGLVVEVTDGTLEYNATHYRISVFYDLVKFAVNRLAFSQGHELHAHGATAVSLTPGFLRSEMMLENFGVTEARWRDALAPTASPRHLRASRCQSRRDMWDVRSPHWPPIPSDTAGTNAPSPLGRWRRSTASPTLMVRDPTFGNTAKTSTGGWPSIRVPTVRAIAWRSDGKLAPQIGFEPITLRLTAGCSTIELLRNGVSAQLRKRQYISGPEGGQRARSRPAAGLIDWCRIAGSAGAAVCGARPATISGSRSSVIPCSCAQRVHRSLNESLSRSTTSGR